MRRTIPVVAHLHGTELQMLDAIEEQGHHNCPHAWAWADRMRTWAARAQRLIVLSESQLERVERPAATSRPSAASLIPNGFEPDAFAPARRRSPRPLAPPPRRRAAGVAARRPSTPASMAYEPADLEAFADGGPVLLYVGRFTPVKRVRLLIEAYARARPGFLRRAPLVLVGGYPGEWEGEHPAEAVARTGARDVFLAGWHGHDELPGFLGAADVVVLPSVREQFGQVLVEGMACARPAIAVDAHGPSEIVRHGQTGWLVEPDDPVALANAMVEVVNRPEEARRRGRLAARGRAGALRVARAGRAGGRDVRRGAGRRPAARRPRRPVLASACTPALWLVEPCLALLPFRDAASVPRRAPGARHWTAPPRRPHRSACTTRPMSTMPAASRWSRG